MNRDVISLIHELIHRDLMKQLNEEYHIRIVNMNAAVILGCFSFNFRLLDNSIRNESIYNLKKTDNDVVPFDIVAHLPSRYVYSSGKLHPNGFK